MAASLVSRFSVSSSTKLNSLSNFSFKGSISSKRLSPSSSSSSPSTSTSLSSCLNSSGASRQAGTSTVSSLFSHHNVPITPSPLNTRSTVAVPAFSFACEKSALTRLYETHAGPNKEHAFFVNDLGVVERQYKRFIQNLPNVKPFYAVKCNPDQVLIRSLVSQGASFDCASGAEMELVLAEGVKPEDIIFANPIKNARDLKYAAKVGVKKMTFDNVDELHKIALHHPNAELVLRLLPDDSGSLMRFGAKFGAPLKNIPHMFETAKQLKLNIIGCSFHIGSGCFDCNKYDEAITLAKSVFTMAEKMGLPKFTLLDLGGGFPGNPNPNQKTPAEGGRMTPAFEEFATVIRSSLEKNFPSSSGVRVIAEPGRYMATAWSTLFTLVQGKREEPVPSDSPKKFLYYINDGVYGSFNCLMFDHAHPLPVPAYRFMNDRKALHSEEIAFVKNKTKKTASQPLSLHSNNSILSLSSSIPDYTLSSSDQQQSISMRAAHSDAVTTPRPCTGTFFGPTCDSMDVIATDYPIEELFVGDWLAFEQFGAYTSASSTTFNGMERPIHHYVRSSKPSPVVA